MRALLAVLVLGPAVALAQRVAQPADAAREGEAHNETLVSAPRAPGDDEAVGPYGQPGWTTQRRFPTTRVYVIPDGAAELEWWFDPRFERGGHRLRTLWEMEFGLGHRLQLDLYLRFEDTTGRPIHLESERAELRYALADWGKLPGNPTLYVEWTHDFDGVQSLEGKLLLGGALAPRWHWGANAIFEHHFNSFGDNEYNATLAVSRSVRDAKLSVGAEVLFESSDNNGVKLSDVALLAGPSVQWRPTPRAHLDLVALFGSEWLTGAGAFAAEPLLVVGWQF